MNQPIQKSGSNKTIFIVLAVAIFLFLCFCCSVFMAIALFGTNTKTYDEVEDFPVFESEEFEEDSDSDYVGVEYLNMDEKSNIDGIELSITELDQAYQPDQDYLFLDPSKKYYAVEVYLVNNSGESHYYSDYDFKLKDSDSYTYPNIFSGSKVPSLASGTLPAGGEVRGWVTFEVPQTNEDFTLVYSDLSSNRSVEFSLR